MQAACSGFIYSLNIASQFIANGSARKIIVVGADKMSSIIDYTDRATCVLFGDGAGAVLLEPRRDTATASWIRWCVPDGAGWVHLHQKAGGSRIPASAESVALRKHYVHQEGAAVYNSPSPSMAEV